MVAVVKEEKTGRRRMVQQQRETVGARQQQNPRNVNVCRLVGLFARATRVCIRAEEHQRASSFIAVFLVHQNSCYAHANHKSILT